MNRILWLEDATTYEGRQWEPPSPHLLQLLHTQGQLQPPSKCCPSLSRQKLVRIEIVGAKGHTCKPLVHRSSGRNKVFALWWSHQTSLRPSRSVRLDWGDALFVAGLDSMFKTCWCHAMPAVPALVSHPLPPANKSRTQGTVYSGTIEQYPPSAPERLAIDDAACSSKEGNCASKSPTLQSWNSATVYSIVLCQVSGSWSLG